MFRLVLLIIIVAAIPAVVASACSPYVDPCACGLCPKIVDCSTQQHKAECFCGGRMPGVYAAVPMPTINNGTATTTQDPSRFFMCGVRAPSKVHTGVEMRCPYPLVFNATQRACV
jgi:hypothetical protein